MKIKDYGEVQCLDSVEEYQKELITLRNELAVSIGTNTLIENDLKLLKRCEELIVIISFLEGKLKEVV